MPCVGSIIIYLFIYYFPAFRGENAFDFAIRTPCTPARWNDFDAEMTAAWEVC